MNISKYRVSVIMVSYNSEPFLAEAIESVLNQTLQPYEIIICDDGSTDNSWQIIEAYHSRYPNLIIPNRHENLGIAGNINSGLELARGNLVTSIGGDDRFLPEKLEFELKTFDENPEAALVFSNFYYIDDRGHRIGLWAKRNAPPTGSVLKESFSRSWPGGDLYRNALVDLNALKKVGFYDEGLRLYEDWDFKIRFTSEFKVAYCPVPLIEYRKHPKGIAKTTSADSHLNTMKRIYAKNRHLLESLSESDRSDVEKTLSNIFLYHEALAALERGHRVSALRKYIGYLKANPVKVTNWALLLIFLLPNRAYESIRTNRKIQRAWFLLKTLDKRL